MRPLRRKGCDISKRIDCTFLRSPPYYFWVLINFPPCEYRLYAEQINDLEG